jgi:hypothetical protein
LDVSDTAVGGSASDSSGLCEKVKGTSVPEIKRAAREVPLLFDTVNEAAVTKWPNFKLRASSFKPYRQGLGVRIFAQASERGTVNVGEL